MKQTDLQLFTFILSQKTYIPQRAKVGFSKKVLRFFQTSFVSKPKAKAFFFIFFYVAIGNVKAQYLINKNPSDEHLIISTMDLIYNFQFEEAQKQILEVKKLFPNHPVHHFLYAMYYFWEMIPMSLDNPKYKTYEYHLLKTIELSESLLRNENTKQEATYYTMAAKSSLVVINLKANDYTNAIAEGRKTYNYMKDGFEWTDKYPDFNFSTGLYYFYAEQYPETHPAIQPVMWFFAKGDKEKGINLLKKSAEKSLFSKTESIYFLAHVYLKYYTMPLESMKYGSRLIEKYPNNYFYQARYLEALVLAKKYAEAKPIIDKLIRHQSEYFQIIGYLFAGMSESAIGNYSAAKKHFELSQKLAVNSDDSVNDYLAFSYLGLGLIYEKENNLKKAVYYFNKLEEIGEYKLHRQEAQAFKARHKR